MKNKIFKILGVGALCLVGSVTFSACKKDAYYVTFTQDGASQVINKNSLKSFPKPEKTGYVFCGWYEDALFNHQIDEEYFLSHGKNEKNNNIFYAKFVPIIKTVENLQNEYEIGDSLNLTGAKIVCYNEDLTTYNVNLNSEMISNFNTTKVGSFTMTVIYKGCSYDFSYTVKEKVVLSSIEITTNPKTTYYASATGFDVTNAKLKLTMNDGSNQEISITSSMLSAFDNTVGEHTCTVTYEGKTTSFNYTIEAVELESVELKTSPKATYYASATGFDVTNAKLKLTMNDGSSEEISITSSMLSAFDNTAGEHTCTVTYEGKTTSFNYTIEAVKLESIELTTSPKATYYASATGFDVTNAKLKLTMNDGSSEEISITNSMLSAFDNTVGEHTCTVTYEGKTASFNYTIEAVKAVTINTVDGIESKYFINEDVKLTNAKINVTNNDGSVENVELTKEMIKGFDSSNAGDFTLSLEYELAELQGFQYQVKYQEYIAQKAVKISNNTETELPNIFYLKKLNVNDNSYSIQYKENNAGFKYNELVSNSTDTQFMANETNYNLIFNDTIELNDGTYKYDLVPLQLATMYSIDLNSSNAGSVGFDYCELNGSPELKKAKTVRVFAGEKINLIALPSKGYLATRLYIGNNIFSYTYDKKSYSFIATKDTFCNADFEKATNVMITFKLKVEGNSYITEEDDVYGFQCKANFVFTNFKINNSEEVQGKIDNRYTEIKFSNEYPYGYATGTDQVGDSYTIEDSYTWEIRTYIGSNSEIDFRSMTSSVSVYYPKLDQTRNINESSSADQTLELKAGDETTYTQQIKLDDYLGRFSFVLEITVQEL